MDTEIAVARTQDTAASLKSGAGRVWNNVTGWLTETAVPAVKGWASEPNKAHRLGHAIGSGGKAFSETSDKVMNAGGKGIIDFLFVSPYRFFQGFAEGAGWTGKSKDSVKAAGKFAEFFSKNWGKLAIGGAALGAGALLLGGNKQNEQERYDAAYNDTMNQLAAQQGGAPQAQIAATGAEQMGTLQQMQLARH